MKKDLIKLARQVDEEKDTMEDVVGNCPSCKAYTVFRYIGYQEGVRDVQGFPLYECRTCQTSHSLRSLMN